MAFHTYLLRCADGTYYAGHTDDLVARLRQHESAETGYVSTRRPVEVVWHGEFESREEALKFELQIKGWSRAKKEALIAGDWEEIERLAAARGGRLRQAQPERSDGERLRQAQPERGDGERLRQAQPERSGEAQEASRNPEAQQAVRASVRPELVEGSPRDGERLRQAQPERIAEAEPDQLPAILARNRRAIAKAITLIESTRADHRQRADALLTALIPHTGKGLRLGISGVPGVGKSTFIEALGLMLIARGHRVAVLAIDPSSSVSGGSILGDKTRMERLSVHADAYIRPSPASGTLGGVALKTREAMLVCEAAGYDVVIVETVGVGQSETAVAGMTDMFVLLQLPNAGDDLQAIKKGVVEIADLVVINKADLDPLAARRAEAQIGSALHLLGMHTQAGRTQAGPAQGEPHGQAPAWQPQVMQLSALTGAGLDAFWHHVETFERTQRGNGRFAARRRQQARAWMWDMIHAGLGQRFSQHPAVRGALPDMTAQVLEGRLPASTAARELLALFGADESS